MFVSTMTLTFTSLPAEIRNKIYSSLLVVPRPITIGAIPSAEISTSILLTNKLIYYEANHFVYSSNIFNFTASPADRMMEFLHIIGPRNAAQLTNLQIPFPGFKNKRPGAVRLRVASLRLLQAIREQCTGLTMLMISFGDVEMRAMRFVLPQGRNLSASTNMVGFSATAAEGLLLIDAELRGMSSLKEVIASAYYTTGGALHRKLLELGWTIESPHARKIVDEDYWSRYLQEYESCSGCMAPMPDENDPDL